MNDETTSLLFIVVPIPSDPEVPCYFGRVAGIGGMKKIQEKFNLKNRLYLGPTSLGNECICCDV